jgi:hypothetical protein
MGDEERSWSHAGISKIMGEESRYVRIPDRLFRETSILKLGLPVHWYYETTIGILIISQQHLEKQDYEYSGESRKFREGDSEYTCGVPKAFFEDFKGKGDPDIEPRCAELVNLQRDGWLHFIYHDEMVEGRVKSCYVLTEDQFDQRFSASDRWAELDQVPRFH